MNALSRRILLCLLLGTMTLPAIAAEPTRVRVTTSAGSFVIELDAERAPLTCANFLRYVREGHYSGTIFHRVVAGFVVQGGGYAADYKGKPTHESVPNESGNGRRNTRGTVGLARTAAPHSGNTQFYINVGENPDLDPLPSRWGYAVFGQVVEGLDVVDRISVSPTGSGGPFKSEVPATTVLIQSIVVIEAQQ